MDDDRKRYQEYVKHMTGNPANPIERKIKAVGRGIIAFWMIFAFVFLLLFLIFFDEAVFGQQIL
ncbi:MAG: hypothetical protein WCV86_00280 [Patescibacteria group bacterium]|jgi:hypothetical protein